MKFNVVIVESVISCVVGEECSTISLSSSFLEQAFHYITNFKVRKEGLMLGFKDQFKGSDDII